MKLQTLVEIPKPNFVITPTHRVAIVGSCFADNIASKMELINSSDKWEELLSIITLWGLSITLYRWCVL